MDKKIGKCERSIAINAVRPTRLSSLLWNSAVPTLFTRIALSTACSPKWHAPIAK